MSIEAVSPISPVLPEHTSPEDTGHHGAPGFEQRGHHPDLHHGEAARGPAPADASIGPVTAVDELV